MKDHQIQIDGEKCIGCGLCRRDCPVGNLEIIDKKAVPKGQSCTKCGHCVAVCPKAAVSMTGFDEPPAAYEKQARVDPGQLLEALRSRRSIRHFQDRPVEAAAIERIVEAGRLTPTAKNAQDVSYIVIQQNTADYEKTAGRFFRKLLPLGRLFYAGAKNVTIDDQFLFKKAPAAILILARDPINGALAASNMALMAEAVGLGVLYSGFITMAANHSPAFRRQLGLTRRDRVVTTLVLGYSNVTYRRTAPKEAAVVRYL